MKKKPKTYLINRDILPPPPQKRLLINHSAILPHIALHQLDPFKRTRRRLHRTRSFTLARHHRLRIVVVAVTIDTRRRCLWFFRVLIHEPLEEMRERVLCEVRRSCERHACEELPRVQRYCGVVV